MDNFRFINTNSNVNAVAFTSNLVQKAYNLKNPQSRLGFTKDRLFMHSTVIVFRKKSVLTTIFNEKLMTLREFGLIDYWMRNSIDDRKSKSKKTEPAQLRLENIVAAFQICGVLYLIGLVVFMLEVISTKCKRVKCILDYFNY